MTHPPSLIDEIEAALGRGTPERRSEMLRRVTDLFLDGAEQFEDAHVAVLDDVMARLIESVERYALVRLSLQLAPHAHAPIRTVQQLGLNDDIGVAGPVLEHSNRMTDDFLVEVARTKSQAHLASIAGRIALSEIVTDVVVERGDATVTRKVAGNPGARFSETGFRTMAGRARDDGDLAATMAERPDVPAELFDDLVRNATEIVRERLRRSTRGAARPFVDAAIEAASRHVGRIHRGAGGPTLAATPEQLKAELCRQAKLGERDRTTALLADLTEVPAAAVKNLVRQQSDDGLLILCKAAGLGWSDARTVLAVVAGRPCDPRAGFEKYLALTADSAQRVVRFIRLRKRASSTEISRLL